jgi:alkanesulfonate monooxygenase SsuD/methylene tetrahydromethanopterin reductase-like flavin-dependent oxidoreductase (luciferase family)
MISKFVTVYPGHIDMPDLGQNATPANDRKFSNDELASVFEKTEAVAMQMDKFGWDTLWLAEHHFQHEGYEVLPNLLMLAVHLSHVTEKLKIGCGFNIAPMWHPLRLAEDYAVADILTKGRTVFGWSWLLPEWKPSAVRCRTRRQRAVRGTGGILFKAFNSDRFSHRGKYYTLPPDVPYRGTAEGLDAGAAAGDSACRMLAADRLGHAARHGFHDQARHQGCCWWGRCDDGRRSAPTGTRRPCRQNWELGRT